MADGSVTPAAHEISTAPPPAHLVTAHEVRLAWLGCCSDDATDTLAELALDAIAQRDAYRQTLYAALEQLGQVTQARTQAQSRNLELTRELRQRRAPSARHRSAA